MGPIKAFTADEIKRIEAAVAGFLAEAKTCLENGKTDDAAAAFRKVYEIEKYHGNARGMAEVLIRLSQIHEQRGELEEATRTATMAVAMFPDPHPWDEVARAWASLGHLSIARREFVEAQFCFQKAIEIRATHPKAPDHGAAMADLSLAIGTAYLLDEQLDHAKPLLLAALDWELPLGRDGPLSTIYGNLGVICLSQYDLDGAEKYLRSVLSIHERLQLPGTIAVDYANLGLVQVRLGNLDVARQLWLKGLDCAKEASSEELAALLGRWLKNPPDAETLTTVPLPE